MQLSANAIGSANHHPFTVEHRFCGPPGSGNGGYVAARLGGAGPARVLFRRPVPLGRGLTVSEESGRVELRDGARLLVEAAPGIVPEPLALSATADDIAELAPVAQPEDHPFPGCFVCGPDNQEGLGLSFRRLGPSVGGVFAPPAHETEVPAEYIVGALDCTSGWASFTRGEAGVLGTIEYAIVGEAAPGQRLISIGAFDEQDGRKRFARSSVYTDRGDLIGSAHTIWIEIELPRCDGRSTAVEQIEETS